MASVSVLSTRLALPLIRLPKIRCKPMLSSLVFFASDTLAITATGSLIVLASQGSSHGVSLLRYLQLWPALGVLFAVFAYSGLYPGIIHNAVAELRRLALSLTICFLIVAGMIVVAGNADHSTPAFLVLWWLAASLVTPMLRSVARGWFCRKPWWGIPIAVFYTGDESGEMIRELELHPEIGLRPVVVLSAPHVTRRKQSVPVLDLRMASAIRACGVERAMIALPDAGSGKLLAELEMYEGYFPRLMIMHTSTSLYNLTVDARQLGHSLAVEVRRDLLLPLPRLAKRVMDVLIVCFCSAPVALTVLVLALLVRLESPGPVFYGHRRIGRSRSTFLTWKIRTMQVNGDELLKEAFERDGTLREEWLRNRKLRRDPRITRVGSFLRKTSLDELPQLWNVLRGEMSLVGPRPIVADEVAGYGLNFSLYCRVTPGLTGLWQVSGRNDVGLRDRVCLDSYYVRNWSPWLDLHILARSAKVVLTGRGAY